MPKSTDQHNKMVSTNKECEGKTYIDRIGYIFTKQIDGATPLYRCLIKKNNKHFISVKYNCEGEAYKREGLMGYVLIP